MTRPHTLPPFLAGRAAYHASEPMSSNPHPKGVVHGDDYPGAWANWRDGWKHAKATHDHDRKLLDGKRKD